MRVIRIQSSTFDPRFQGSRGTFIKIVLVVIGTRTVAPPHFKRKLVRKRPYFHCFVCTPFAACMASFTINIRYKIDTLRAVKVRLPVSDACDWLFWGETSDPSSMGTTDVKPIMIMEKFLDWNVYNFNLVTWC